MCVRAPPSGLPDSILMGVSLFIFTCSGADSRQILGVGPAHSEGA